MAAQAGLSPPWGGGCREVLRQVEPVKAKSSEAFCGKTYRWSAATVLAMAFLSGESSLGPLWRSLLESVMGSIWEGRALLLSFCSAASVALPGALAAQDENGAFALRVTVSLCLQTWSWGASGVLLLQVWARVLRSPSLSLKASRLPAQPWLPTKPGAQSRTG